MKMPKKHPRKQLEKFSTIFTQLGLVLVLFLVYIIVEHETEKKDNIPISYGDELHETYKIDEPLMAFTKEVLKAKVNPVNKSQEPIVDLTKIEKVDNTYTITNVIDLPSTEVTPKIDINSLLVAKEDNIKDSDEPETMFSVQKAPVFKGCEGLDEAENRQCLENKIKEYVQRYFNAEIAQDLGMRSGKYSIYTQFVIDKNGDITDMKIRAPHAMLKKEVEKVITKIPSFTPGMKNDQPVKVRYTLPITFRVE